MQRELLAAASAAAAAAVGDDENEMAKGLGGQAAPADARGATQDRADQVEGPPAWAGGSYCQ
jgi:hypothetical protein